MFTFVKQIKDEINKIKANNAYKTEQMLSSQQGAEIIIDGKQVLNFCSNNYLGMSNDPRVIDEAKQALDRWGYGLSSVRFICGTQEIHKQLERKISKFLGTDETILYSSCFDANGGFFETITTIDDMILTDELNHASIIDGIRLSKAERKIYKHMDLRDLEQKLIEAKNKRRRIIATDGVFSVDGDIANLPGLCDLADKYQALLLVDDSHATGILGDHGRGTHEYHHVMDRIDIITSSFGKALGGASGGFTTGKKELIDLFRQRSRPYLFSNSLAPVIAATTMKIIELVQQSDEARRRLNENTEYFRKMMTKAGFNIRPGIHPIVPIMLFEEKVTQNMASDLRAEGIYVTGFSYPVVQQGKSRIRVQLSAAHTREQLDMALESFIRIGRKYQVILK